MSCETGVDPRQRGFVVRLPLRSGGRLDLSRLRFGRWTVLAIAPQSVRSGRVRRLYWHCVCDCGCQRLVSGNSLRHGRSTSCGCPIDLTGMKFGRWTVLALHPQRVRNGRAIRTLWRCICDCGRARLVFATNLRRGLSTSCGCRIPETIIARSTKHSQARRLKHTRVYDCWVGMRQRCYNPNNNSYADYGGRGITVCERWHRFANFFADMGHPPRGKSLDRINVNGNYEPGNCRWASVFEQARNKRRYLPKI
jgi:hypothetical protein